MKKIFEIPEVSSVELAGTDVIMVSGLQLANDNSTIGFGAYSESINEGYKMWKGFNNAQ